MKPQRQRSQDVTGFLSLGVDEERENLHEAKPVEMSLIREGGEEEKGIQPKPEQGAASAGEKEEAEEGSYGGPDGPGTPGAMNDENHEASGDSGGEPREQRQEEQPLQAVAQRRQPWDRQQVVQRPMFTQVQVQELERIFRHNAYPNLFMRQEIARRMNVPEARVQIPHISEIVQHLSKENFNGGSTQSILKYCKTCFMKPALEIWKSDMPKPQIAQFEF